MQPFPAIKTLNYPGPGKGIYSGCARIQLRTSDRWQSLVSPSTKYDPDQARFLGIRTATIKLTHHLIADAIAV
jgi:hypothetical protein